MKKKKKRKEAWEEVKTGIFLGVVIYGFIFLLIAHWIVWGY